MKFINKRKPISTEELEILQEAVDWALDCTTVISMAHAVEWAIAEYRWNLADEDSMSIADRKVIKHKNRYIGCYP